MAQPARPGATRDDKLTSCHLACRCFDCCNPVPRAVETVHFRTRQQLDSAPQCQRAAQRQPHDGDPLAQPARDVERLVRRRAQVRRAEVAQHVAETVLRAVPRQARAGLPVAGRRHRR